MKRTVIRLVLALMILTLVFTVAACTKDDPNPSETTPADTTLHTHTYKSTVIPATCTEAGYTIHLCEGCGDTYHDAPTAMTAHTYGEWKTTAAASCTAEGSQMRTCTVCGNSETEKLEKTEHFYVDDVVAPTKTTPGYTVHTCKYCKDSKTDSHTNATGSVGLEYQENADKTLTIVGVGDCTGEHLENIIIYSTNAEGKTVTAIAPGAFAGIKEIKSISLPASLTNIGAGAFAGCEKLEKVSVEADSKTYSSSNNVIYSADGKTIVLFPAGSAATSFTIGKDITNIAPGAFAGCEKLVEFKIENETRNTVFRIVDGVLYKLDALEDENDTTQSVVRLIAYPTAKKDVTAVKIPATVTEVDAFAFFGNQTITSVAFENRTYPTTDEEGNPIEKQVVTNTVGAFAFANCQKLKSVDFGNDTAVLGAYTFACCFDLETVKLSNRISVIPQFCFADCESLKTIILPDLDEAEKASGVVSVSSYAFYNCEELKTVVVGNAVTAIEAKAFEGCDEFDQAFYKGDYSDWSRIESGIHQSNTTFYLNYLYYYSDTAPTNTIGKYWHYVASVPTAW